MIASTGFSFLPGAHAQVDSGFIASENYGQDFSAYALIIVALAVLCMTHRLFTWLVSAKPYGQRLSIASAVLLLGVSHATHSHHRCSILQLWLVARQSGLAPYLFWAILSLGGVAAAILYEHAAAIQRRAKAP
jgi:hypothetical protein